MLLCTNLEFLKEDLIAAGLSDKAPSIKKNTCTLIEKAV